MKFKQTVIEGIETVIPPETMTSEALENRLSGLYERLKLPHGRLELMTGIKERRYWPEPKKPSAIASEAAEALLQKLALKPNDIDLLIFTGVCRDQLEPATASTVHHRLGLSSETILFDLSNACLGFLNGLSLAGKLVSSGTIRRALVVSGENGHPLLERTLSILENSRLDRSEIKPYFANFTIGSGGAAACVTHQDHASKDVDPMIMTHSIHRADTRFNELCQGDQVDSGWGLEMQTDSEKMLQAGIALAKETWTAFLEETQWNIDTPEAIISHQVGKQHRRELYKALSLDIEKDYSTFERLGNVGSASVPITLAQALSAEHIIKDDLVALLGIGSGLTCMMIALEA